MEQHQPWSGSSFVTAGQGRSEGKHVAERTEPSKASNLRCFAFTESPGTTLVGHEGHPGGGSLKESCQARALR